MSLFGAVHHNTVHVLSQAPYHPLKEALSSPLEEMPLGTRPACLTTIRQIYHCCNANLSVLQPLGNNLRSALDILCILYTLKLCIHISHVVYISDLCMFPGLYHTVYGVATCMGSGIGPRLRKTAQSANDTL